MSKVNTLLTQRFQSAKAKLSKMTNLVEMASNGELSSFSGVFRVSTLTDPEKESLKNLLENYRQEAQEIDRDLSLLSSLTAEVKAINNQAILLHGERIKRAQEILKNYREGAFSAWLVATYGNRQTPYNFLQYYELQRALPHELQLKIDDMPRQAVYSLASRAGEMMQKEEIIKNYQGEPKQALLELIRETFPLADTDHRKQDLGEVALATLTRLHKQLSGKNLTLSDKQRKKAVDLLKALNHLLA